MSDLDPYSITLEADLRGRWHWSVSKAPFGQSGPSLFLEGFFRDYAYGSERTEEKAEKKAREWIARAKAEDRMEARDQARRALTRKVIT
jgi:hypothetical protein